MTQDRPIWRYSPHPIDAYLLPGVDVCPFRVLRSMPRDRGTAAWNVQWCCDPDVDRLPEQAAHWSKVYRIQPNLVPAIIQDVGMASRTAFFLQHPVLLMEEQARLPELLPRTFALLGEETARRIVAQRLVQASDALLRERPALRVVDGRLRIAPAPQ